MKLRKDLVLIGLFISILALMIIPLPSQLIDLLLAINISLSVTLLMVAIYLKRPSDFSTFPAVILIATAFRLALSIATTRLILSQADAGRIIATFGEFVISGSVIIGLVIFLIITVVQFVVVTKGAERVAEVAARFTLDAMPGKQMSIEADIRAGSLDQDEGALKRKGLDKDSQFFGAMDGAMKFVKGDAIAGLIIIFINLLGGIAVGTSVHDYTLAEATSVYSLLTIGDGLVAQIPALLMSLCAGTIVTRVANENAADLGHDIVTELFSDPRVPASAALVILAFGFVPGFPTAVFAVSAAALFAFAVFGRRQMRQREREAEDAAAKADAEAKGDGPILPACDRIGLHVSAAAAEALDLDRIVEALTHRVIRFSERYGVLLPHPFVAVGADPAAPSQFHFELDEVPLSAGTILPDTILTTAQPKELEALGIAGDHPLIDWFTANPPYRAVSGDAAAALAKAELRTQSYEDALAEALFRQQEARIGTLFSKQAFAQVVANAKALDEALADEVTEKLGVTNLMMLFRYLLEDGVPLRPTRLFWESLSHWTHLYEDASPVFLAECLRTSLRRQMCQNMSAADGEIGVVLVAPQLQNRLIQDLKTAKKASGGIEVSDLPVDPEILSYLKAEALKLRDLDIEEGRRVVIVAASELRRRLRDFLSSLSLNLPVFAPHEISDEIITVPFATMGEDFRETGAGQGPQAARRRPLQGPQPIPAPT